MISKQELIHLYARVKIEDAAKQLGLGVTALKKRCRQVGIQRWPHRQLKSIDNLVRALVELQMKEHSAGPELEDAISQLSHYRHRILIDPNFRIPDSVFRLRQAQFKDRHRRAKVKS